ncbi:hypothetical protein EXIGLDRAFT_776017 [Exidia glandulosa HHB12029]|uniref:Glyoxylate reductase n=1 Tax=Exidia glandulosa HHB12029 TaxID=1314781 RepID=A0A165DNA3_EXIGL|nr:hypothetical protein EXIGLDRAFT_776017 [Exidia glandulosa HHB12029]
MSRPRIIILFQTFPSTILRAAHEAGLVEIVYLSAAHSDSAQARRDWFMSQLPGASAAVLWNDIGKFGKEHLDAAGPSFKVLATYSVGYDHVDVAECQRRGVAVAHTPNKNDDSVANCTLMLLLMAMRRAMEHITLVRQGGWGGLHQASSADPLTLTGLSVRRKTVGLYGFGPIAQKVVERILPMSPRRILYKASQPRPFTHNHFPRLHHLVSNFYSETVVRNEPDLVALAAESDVLICLTSLTPETYHSIDADLLSRMKPSAVLVNMARGPVVDTPALIDALHKDGIFCAAVDVLEGEPDIRPDHPLLDESLAHKVIVFPHSASGEADARWDMGELTARNVLFALGIDVPEGLDVEGDTGTRYLPVVF